MVVKTRPVAREVAAIYTVDEISMELVVKLSTNHPLLPVSVECGKRIGVSNQLWRQWMLQLNTFLSFQVSSYSQMCVTRTCVQKLCNFITIVILKFQVYGKGETKTVW